MVVDGGEDEGEAVDFEGCLETRGEGGCLSMEGGAEGSSMGGGVKSSGMRGAESLEARRFEGSLSIHFGVGRR